MKRTTSSLPASRIDLLRGVTIVVTLLVVARLFEVSVIGHGAAISKAKEQYSIKETIAAERGQILLQDLNGGPNYPVALTTDSFTVVADPFLISDPAAIATNLTGPLTIPIPELLEKLADKHKRFVVLKKQLSKEQGEQIESLNLKGVSVLTIPARYYPESNLAASVIGFVNADGEGKYGIEGFFNDDLKGYNGSLVGLQDARRRLVSEDKSAKPRNGTDLVLTIDHNLQFVVEQKLKEAVKQYEADGGSIVVVDTKTGAILAMANEPTFDLNSYNTVKTEDQRVFINEAAASSYEPGSVFKTFTLASGIDLGLFDPSTKMELGCSVTINNYEIHNAEDKCYNNPDVTTVLTQSINLGTVWASEKIGNSNFAKYIADFGFGSKTGIEIQPEVSGKVADVKKWRDVNRATMSFGQGLTVTPLQLVMGYATIANGGKLMHPYLVAERTSEAQKITTSPREVRQVIKPETAAIVTGMLEKVVTEGHGKKAAVAGYRVAGKTGTAQVVGPDGKYIANVHIGSFGGFFPANEPRFAMVVKLDKPKAVEFAESSAAPTFGAIASWLLHYAKVPPTEPTQ